MTTPTRLDSSRLLTLMILASLLIAVAPFSTAAAVDADPDIALMYLTRDDIASELPGARLFQSAYLPAEEPGEVRGYSVWYVEDNSGGAAFSYRAVVGSDVYQYDDEDSARAGFDDLAGEQRRAEAAPAFGVEEVGDESIASVTLELWTTDGDCPTSTLSFRADAYVARVIVADCSMYDAQTSGSNFIAMEPFLSGLGKRLLHRIQGRRTGTTPNLSAKIVRLSSAATDADGYNQVEALEDGYQRLAGERVVWSETSEAVRALNERQYGEASDVYYVAERIRFPRFAQYRVLLLHFDAPETAAAYVDDSEAILADLNRLPVALPDMPTFGDQSVVYAVIRDDMSALYTQGLQAFIRVGEEVALVSLYYEGADSISALSSLATAQADCLAAETCNPFQPVPDDFST